MNVDILIEGMDSDDLNSIIKAYDTCKDVKESIDKKMDKLSKLIIKKMNLFKWENYRVEENDISVSLVSIPEEVVDKKALKILLNEEQYNQVIIKRKKDKLQVLNKKDKARLRNYVKKQ